jgi:hypothetical protein
MSADRELLTLAAKAAGYFPAVITDDGVVFLRGTRVKWSPRTDDGDALRLAVALNLKLQCGSNLHRVSAADRNDFEPFFEYYDEDESNKGQAMRDAIVSAAAEIGKAMP